MESSNGYSREKGKEAEAFCSIYAPSLNLDVVTLSIICGSDTLVYVCTWCTEIILIYDLYVGTWSREKC